MRSDTETASPPPPPKRLPWIPPRFRAVSAELGNFGSGHTYFDNDDGSTPGGRNTDPNPPAVGVDQSNPYNS